MNHVNMYSMNLLHWEFDNSSLTPDVAEHSHGYWQIELCAEGRICFIHNGDTHQLEKGDGVCLPPGITHEFHNFGSYYSFKFILECSGPVPDHPVVFPSSPLTIWALENFSERRKQNDILLEIGRERPILEALIGALVHDALSGEMNMRMEPKLAARLRHWVSNAGKQPSVAAAAEYCGMNVNQLKYKFAQEVSAVNPAIKSFSVKRFLDEALMERIDRYLAFTKLSLHEISTQLGFKTVYTFSRFCSRMTGMPPGSRRIRFRHESGLASLYRHKLTCSADIK